MSAAAPASTSLGATESAAREPSSRPRRIFTVTGTATASATADDDPAGAIRVLEQRRTGAGLRDLPDRAAEVDVDDVGARVLDHARGLGHDGRLGAEDLHCERVLVRADQQVAERALVPYERPGAAHHLGADESCAEAASLASKGLHADACHRCEDEPGRDLDRPDPPGCCEGRSRLGNDSRAIPVSPVDGR